MDMNDLVKAQARVVSALQLRVIRDCTGDDGKWQPCSSGEVKDVAIALGVAVDKLDVLIARRVVGG